MEATNRLVQVGGNRFVPNRRSNNYRTWSSARPDTGRFGRFLMVAGEKVGDVLFHSRLYFGERGKGVASPATVHSEYVQWKNKREKKEQK